jgi:2-polyprenyl-3-methyl-5-hydroxy-6-metoxy-1,4-benzoquinol methylase
MFGGNIVETDNYFLRLKNNECPFCSNTEADIFFRGIDQFYKGDIIYNILQCKNCEGVFLDGSHFDNLKTYYELSYKKSYHSSKFLSNEEIPLLRKHPVDYVFNHSKRVSLLDIGCGAGGFLRYMQSKGHSVMGVEYDDMSANMVSDQLSCNVYKGGIENVCINEKFDVVTLWDVLEHFVDPIYSLNKIRKLLNPNGIIIFGVPNFNSFESKMLRLSWFGLDVPRHTIQCTPYHLNILFSNSGYSVEKLKETRISSYFKKSFNDKRLVYQGNRLNNKMLILFQYIFSALAGKAYIVGVVKNNSHD